MITPIAKSLIGKRSAVVLKTPGGNIRENLLPAGKICLHADQDAVVDLDEGAEKIMQVVSDADVYKRQVFSTLLINSSSTSL